MFNTGNESERESQDTCDTTGGHGGVRIPTVELSKTIGGIQIN